MIRNFFHNVVFVLAVLSYFTLSAQQVDGQPDRDAVVIDYFFTARGVSPAYAERVRSGVVEGFLRRGRHRVIDARMVRELYLEEAVWRNARWGQRETAWQQDLRKERMGSLGGRYLLVGYVSRAELSRREDSREVDIVFSLTSYDLASGEVSDAQEFRLTGSGRTVGEAEQKAFESLPAKMEYYIDTQFRFETCVLQLEAPDAKGRYKELYLGCGTSQGVRSGDRFLVYQWYEVAGREAVRLLGKVRVRQVCGPQVARCSISNGAEEIARAFLQGDSLQVVSDTRALF